MPLHREHLDTPARSTSSAWPQCKNEQLNQVPGFPVHYFLSCISILATLTSYNFTIRDSLTPCCSILTKPLIVNALKSISYHSGEVAAGWMDDEWMVDEWMMYTRQDYRSPFTDLRCTCHSQSQRQCVFYLSNVQCNTCWAVKFLGQGKRQLCSKAKENRKINTTTSTIATIK